MVLKHIHTLRKIRGPKKDSPIFQCNDPKCTWREQSKFIEGKAFKCNYCSNEFIFRPSMKRTRFPHCPACTTRRNKETPQDVREQTSVLDELLGDFNVD